MKVFTLHRIPELVWDGSVETHHKWETVLFWHKFIFSKTIDSVQLRVCLHIPTPSPSPSQCLSKFNIVSMVDGQNGSVTHSASQTARHHWHNVKLLMGTVTASERVTALKSQNVWKLMLVFLGKINCCYSIRWFHTDRLDLHGDKMKS